MRYLGAVILACVLAGCAMHTVGTIRDSGTGEPVYTLDLDGQPEPPKILRTVIPAAVSAAGLPPWLVSLVGLLGAGMGADALTSRLNLRRTREAYAATVDELAEGNPRAVEVAKKHQQRTKTRKAMRKHLDG